MCLFYIDPPYTMNERYGQEVYNHEMSGDDQEALLTQLCSVAGRVVLSGYDNPLYNDMLAGWRKVTKNHFASSRSGISPRVECLWLSPNLDARQERMFG
jgi:DNA adenine methylase